MKSIATTVLQAFDRTGELDIPIDADATVQTLKLEGVSRTYFHFRDGSELVTSLTSVGVRVLHASYTR
ncbi:hypothetical protein [Paraburkholderia sp. J8-2]|uniref:hypothetical protein n=1 Tax=Paraburkholderia sp. J8-2 TaxID=2805440 RepID=UPI002AB606F8|nr:hypothetical protein [Paraburkholderia sp. J8-2]